MLLSIRRSLARSSVNRPRPRPKWVCDSHAAWQPTRLPRACRPR